MNPVTDLVKRLEARTKEVLPENWQEGRNCPECGEKAKRQKCPWDQGGSCPRHYPDNYDPSPYQTVPDADCAEVATLLTSQQQRIEELERENAELRHILNPLSKDKP